LDFTLDLVANFFFLSQFLLHSTFKKMRKKRNVDLPIIGLICTLFFFFYKFFKKLYNRMKYDHNSYRFAKQQESVATGLDKIFFDDNNINLLVYWFLVQGQKRTLFGSMCFWFFCIHHFILT
jgi:hypothetical protein